MERDPDIPVVRRLNDSIVATFSALRAEVEEVRQATEANRHQKPLSNKRSTTSPNTVGEGSRIWVRFFGDFEVFCCGEAVPLDCSGNALTMLKYLLANKPPSVSQDYLMEWFWPSASPKRARWSLNSTVRALRRLLSCWPELVPSSAVLVFKDGCYRICSTVKVVTDVEEFDAAYRRGLRLEKEHRTTQAVAEYKRAMELYRGDYLFQDQQQKWTTIERERLLNAYMDILTRLAGHHVERGQYQQAIQICYELLKKEPGHEESYRRMMECYMSLGLRARALKQYSLCEQMLRSTYQTEPSPETIALHKRVRNPRL